MKRQTLLGKRGANRTAIPVHKQVGREYTNDRPAATTVLPRDAKRTPAAQDFGRPALARDPSHGNSVVAFDLRLRGAISHARPGGRPLPIRLFSHLWHPKSSTERLSRFRSRALGLSERRREGGLRLLFLCQRVTGLYHRDRRADRTALLPNQARASQPAIAFPLRAHAPVRRCPGLPGASRKGGARLQRSHHDQNEVTVGCLVGG